jgi:hypothetical protein
VVPGVTSISFRVLSRVHMTHLGFGTSHFGLDGDPKRGCGGKNQLPNGGFAGAAASLLVPSDFAYAREGCFECPSVRRRNRKFTSFKINLFELHVDPLAVVATTGGACLSCTLVVARVK